MGGEAPSPSKARSPSVGECQGREVGRNGRRVTGEGEPSHRRRGEGWETWKANNI